MKVVYCITNTLNGKVYVGSTVNSKARKRQHFSDLRCGRHYNQYLQRSFNKYGEGTFEWLVLEEVDDADLPKREMFWIERLEACDSAKGFNGTRETESFFRGKKHSLKSKKMMSRARQGSNHPNAALDEGKVREIFRLHRSGLNQKEISILLMVDNTTIQCVLKGKTWKHVGEEPVKSRINNKSGCPGVYLPRNGKKWVAEIWRKGRRIGLGSFSDKQEAINARKEAERRYDGV